MAEKARKEQLQPEVSITVGSADYTMRGTVEALGRIEDTLDMSIGEVLDKCTRLKLKEMAGIIRHAIAAGGQNAPQHSEIEEALLEMGYGEAKWKLFSFLTLSLVPPHMRSDTEKKLKQLKAAR